MSYRAKWGLTPERVDQLFGLCTPFRPPVYGRQECLGMKGRHVLDRRGITYLTAVGSVAGDIRVTTDVGQNPKAAPGMGEVVRRSLKVMHTMAAQVTQLDSGVVVLSRGG